MVQSKIRWRQSDYDELRRITRNFNQQRRREIARNPAAERYLPKPVSLRELKKSITTREEYNFFKRELPKFGKKENRAAVSTSGGKKTKWEINFIKKVTKKVNKRNQNYRNKLNAVRVFSEGIDTGFLRGQMGNARLKDFEPIEFDAGKSTRDWKRFVQSMERQFFQKYDDDRIVTWKSNYIKAIDNNFYGPEFKLKHNELKAMIKSIPNDKFGEIINTHEELTIDFIYGADEAEARLDLIIDLLGYELGGLS